MKERWKDPEYLAKMEKRIVIQPSPEARMAGAAKRKMGITEEVRESIAEKTRQQWAKKTPEELEAMKKKARETKSNRTAEQIEATLQKRRLTYAKKKMSTQDQYQES